MLGLELEFQIKLNEVYDWRAPTSFHPKQLWTYSTKEEQISSQKLLNAAFHLEAATVMSYVEERTQNAGVQKSWFINKKQNPTNGDGAAKQGQGKTTGRDIQEDKQTIKERERQDLQTLRDKREAGANNLGNTWKEVKENTTKTRHTFKVKQETRQTKDRGEETLTKTPKMAKNTKERHAQPTP